MKGSSNLHMHAMACRPSASPPSPPPHSLLRKRCTLFFLKCLASSIIYSGEFEYFVIEAKTTGRTETLLTPTEGMGRNIECGFGEGRRLWNCDLEYFEFDSWPSRKARKFWRTGAVSSRPRRRNQGRPGSYVGIHHSG